MRLAYLIDLFSFLMHEFDKLCVGIRNFFEKIVHLQLIDDPEFSCFAHDSDRVDAFAIWN